MIGSYIFDYMEIVRQRIAQDKFGKRDAPVIHISPHTSEAEGDGLFGTIEVYVRQRSGDTVLIHREPFAAVRTKEDVDDVFARALSWVLMNHTKWPH